MNLHCLVAGDEHGIAQPKVWKSDYLGKVIWGDADDKWFKVIPVGEGTQPRRMAGAAIAPLPGGDGFVLFGGYSTYNEKETDFMHQQIIFDKTWVFRLSPDRTPADVAGGSACLDTEDRDAEDSLRVLCDSPGTPSGSARLASSGPVTPLESTARTAAAATSNSVAAADSEARDSDSESAGSSPSPKVLLDRCSGPSCSKRSHLSKAMFPGTRHVSIPFPSGLLRLSQIICLPEPP